MIVLIVVCAYVSFFVTATNSLPSFQKKDCHGTTCNPISEYCSVFIEGCDKCENICGLKSHNHQMELCANECSEYKQYSPIELEIQNVQAQQRIILILLIILMILICARYLFIFIYWIRQHRSVFLFLKKLRRKNKHLPDETHTASTTFRNVMSINELDRNKAYSNKIIAPQDTVTTQMTTISSRYPAEDSNTPVTSSEYSYENQVLEHTPVPEKK